MKKSIIALLVATMAGTGVLTLMADEERGEREHEREDRSGWLRDDDEGRIDPAYLKDTRFDAYQAECGESCHMAYPPALLPGVAWRMLMASLDEHFGENAELDAETRTLIEGYLGTYSADGRSGLYGERIRRSIRNTTTPLRITETDYFIGQHHEIPRNMVLDNPDVKRFSRCEACHSRAGEGTFSEHDIRIPGYGRWDD